MSGKGDFSRRMLNAMHVVILLGVVVLLALVAYNYSLSGTLSYMSILISVLLLAVVFIQRSAFGGKGAGRR